MKEGKDMRGTRGRITGSVIVVVAAALALGGPVAAGEPVDPGTLNPPPSAEFNPVCEQLGKGIVCDLAFSDPPVVDQAGELFCDGDQVFESWTRSVVGRRIYDADGNLLKRQFREDFAGSFTNPSSGVTVDFVTNASNLHVLSVPGDLASGVSSSAGLSIRITASDGGTVLIDAGRLMFDGATGEILESHGPHHFDDYFIRGDVDALQALCDALA